MLPIHRYDDTMYDVKHDSSSEFFQMPVFRRLDDLEINIFAVEETNSSNSPEF